MQRTWVAGWLLVAACASTPPSRPGVRLDIAPSVPSVFAVEDVGQERETRRYRIKPDELLAASTMAQYKAPEPGLTTGALADAARAIRTFVAPGSWDPDPTRALFVENDELVVRHAPAVLGRVEKFLDTLKANRDTILRLQISYVSIPVEESGILKLLPPIREGLGGVVSRKAVADLKARQAELGITVSGAPRMTLFHGQPGLISIGGRFPYIKAVSLNEDGYSPTIDVVVTGMELRVKAVRNGTGSDRYLVDAGVDLQDLAFMTTMRLTDHYIQFPVKIANRSSGAFVLGTDEAALLVTPPIRGQDGILGSLGSQPRGQGRVNLVVIEVDRSE